MSATLDARIRLNSAEFQGGLNRAVIAANSAVQRMSAQFATLQNVTSFGAIGVAIVGLGQKILTATISFEKYKRQLALTTGGVESAAKKFKELQAIASQPGLDLASAVDAQIRLKEIGYTSDEATKHIQVLAKNIAAFGGGGEELKGVILAFSQISSKGQVFAEEINQIAERLPTVRRLMKDAFGTSNAEEIQKMGVSAREFTDKMINGMQNAQPVAEGLTEELAKIKLIIESVFADESGIMSAGFKMAREALEKLIEAHGVYVTAYTGFFVGEERMKELAYATDFAARMQEKLNDSNADRQKKEDDAAAAAKKKKQFEEQHTKAMLAAISARERIMSMSSKTFETDQEKLKIVEEELSKISDQETLLEALEKAREKNLTLTETEIARTNMLLGLLEQKKTLEESIINAKAAALKKEVQREMMSPQQRRQADRQARAEGRAAKRILNRDLNEEVNKQWKEAEKRGMGDPIKEAGKQALKREVAKQKAAEAEAIAKEAGMTLKKIYTVLQGLATA